MAYSPSLTPRGQACSALAAPQISGAEVLATVGTEVYNSPILGSDKKASFCNVTVTLTHPGADDTVYTTVLLPLSGWNGRYLATGGGGLAAGYGDYQLGDPVSQGWAVSSTDGGLSLDQTVDPQTGEWALNPDGSYNEQLVVNLAYRSVHDMAEISKDLIKQFYKKPASHSYYSGCSNGGRQGYATASKYPHDFDGVLANAPALYAPQLIPADYWPQIVMQTSEAPPFCVFDAYQQAILAACDPLDGVADGLISDYDLLQSCPFDSSSLVGSRIHCAQTNSTLLITPTHASIVDKILQGPSIPDGTRLWYGLAKGAYFSAVANTTTFPNGTSIGQPFNSAVAWIKYLTFREATYDTFAMDYEDFLSAYHLSIARMGPIFGNEAIDLAGFRKAGGKLLTWQGLVDDYIPPSGLLDFRDGIEKRFGGVEAVDEWYRVFLAPGVAHCGGGYGPNPVDPLNALVDWVEKGMSPETLPAETLDEEGRSITRDLCRYPGKIVYGGGDILQASSFSCS